MNDRYGWDDRDHYDRDERRRRHSGEGSRLSGYQDDRRGPNRWRADDDEWRARNRSDFDREQRFGGAGTYGASSHDDDRVGGYGASAGGYGYSSQGRGGSYGSQQTHAGQSDQRRYTSSDYGYGAGQQAGAGQQSYFTGQQHAWEVPSSYGAPGTFGASYGGGTGTYSGGAGGYQGYGDDYREHGYGNRNERGFLQRAGDEIASWFGDEDAARRREADHRGRGPADYIRSDERIREDANDRLTEDWRIDASRVSVMVEKGEVTLSGTVSRREDKRRAEDIVEDISGVKHVQNNLRVEQAAAWTSSGSTASPTSASTDTKAKTNTAPT